MQASQVRVPVLNRFLSILSAMKRSPPIAGTVMTADMKLRSFK